MSNYMKSMVMMVLVVFIAIIVNIAELSDSTKVGLVVLQCGLLISQIWFIYKAIKE